MSPPSVEECLERLAQCKGEMSVVELPAVPNSITRQDLEAVRVLRDKHEQELTAYEEETRRQRKEVRTLTRTLKEKTAERENIENLPERGHQNAEEEVKQAALEEEAKQIALEAQRAKIAEREAQAEFEAVRREQFLLERAGFEEQLLTLRARRQQAEIWASEAAEAAEGCLLNDSDHESQSSECDPVRPPCAMVVSAAVASAASNLQVGSRKGSEAHSLCSVEGDPTSAGPSAAPSAASSAAPSRCSSPTGSDTGGRCLPSVCPTLPIATVVEAPDDRAAGGKGGATSSAPVVTPRKGKGPKGKGKGAAPAPPPTGHTPRLSIVGQQQVAKPSKYVNLHWKATQAPQGIDPQLLVNDPFLAKLADPDEPADRPSTVPDKAFVPALPETIFEAGLTVPGCPEVMLETYFRRCEVAVKLPKVENSKQKQDTADRTNFLGDQRRLNMIGIMLQKHIMQHKEDSNREAILNIKRGVLECNYNIVKLEGLSVIRTVLRQHVVDGSPLSGYVQTNGEAAIWDLAYPDHHYLVYELSKVPQIDERLECMLFQLGFCENMVTCRQNLDTLLKALQALTVKRSLIRRFFVTAHRLGQSLSQKPSRGFQLATLEKLTQTKSPKMPHLSILHFCLALMSRDDAQELFSAEDISLLRGAKALGTAKVCDDCRELAQGLYGVKQICESGEYTNFTGQSVKIEKRRKSLPPRPVATCLSEQPQPQEPAIDTDDCFHEVMQNFVESQVNAADDVIVECHKMVLVYKELAVFFDDLNNVYPPPKDPSDSKLDLVDVFYRFAKLVPLHREQVEEEHLRGKIGTGEC